MNPGRAWYSNGMQLYPHYKIIEPYKPFEVLPNQDGNIVLTYEYPGQKLGIYGTIILLIISIIIIKYVSKKTIYLR